MRGVGESRAAISVVNALPLGVGAALAIDWPARASAEIDRALPARARPAVRPKGSSTRIVRDTAAEALARYGAGGRLRLSVRSTIPARRGLKSSSAVGAAVAQATARACGADPATDEVARLVAEVGRASGLSATGAFDDALVGLVGAGVVTDNRSDRCLRRFDPGSGLAVVLWVPDRPHPLSPQVVDRFRRTPGLAREAVDAALDGDWAAAMAANSALVERAMGYRYAALREAVLQQGAIASSVSGLGPAFAAVAPAARAPRVLRALPAGRGSRRTLPIYRSASRRGGDGG